MRVLTLTLATIAVVSGGASGARAQDAAAMAAQGKRVFIRCGACHSVTSPMNKVGPHLVAIVGRKAASVAGFNYSTPMKAQSFVWTEAVLDRWLTKPSTVVPGTTMAFAGLPKPEDRKALIAYLKKPN